MRKPDQRLISSLNIGLVGHVDCGKSTLVEALSGKWPAVHSEELRRGITIRIGYADSTFYRCPNCREPECYSTSGQCIHCGSKSEPLRTVSYVDAPGHKTLMATVLSGAAVMDAAILVIEANKSCPQPQTAEHLLALETVEIDRVVVAQNKIDLVSEEEARDNWAQIKDFISGTSIEDAPIIPISALQRVGISPLIHAIQQELPTPTRDLKSPPILPLIRSFDVNKPGQPIQKLRGGVLGGSLIQGTLRVGDELEIRPGIVKADSCRPLHSEVKSLHQAGMKLQEVEPGGLVGVGTNLDPALTRSDSLAGQLAGSKGKLPQVLQKISIQPELFEQVIGVEQKLEVKPIKESELLVLNVGVAKTIGKVKSVGKQVNLSLQMPICAQRDARVAISRKVAGKWRLIGYGEIE